MGRVAIVFKLSRHTQGKDEGRGYTVLTKEFDMLLGDSMKSCEEVP